jgi:DNA polymerase-3 subunit gamma/tau
VAQITQEDDTPSAGRSPKRLKSLFKKLVKNVQVKVAPQGGTERSQKKNEEPTAPVVQPADTTPAAPATPKPQSRVRISSIGMTFANLSKSGEKPAFQKENEEEAQTGEQRVFDEDMLLMQWTAMCNRMPQQMTAMATRMKNMTPVITEFPHIEVVIDNEILLDQMKTIQKRIRNTLVTNLHNNDITLHLRLAKPDEVKKILNNREMLEEMRVKHPALEHLLGKLELELV